MLNETDLIFGKLEIKEDFIPINQILLHIFYILYNLYSKKCQNSLPTVQVFLLEEKLYMYIKLLNSTLPGRNVSF